jgi:hypothetical protein
MKKRPGAMVTDGSTWLTEKTRVVATASPAPAANCTVYARLAFKASSVMLAVAETLFAAVEVKSITNEQLAPAPKLAGGDAARSTVGNCSRRPERKRWRSFPGSGCVCQRFITHGIRSRCSQQFESSHRASLAALQAGVSCQGRVCLVEWTP